MLTGTHKTHDKQEPQTSTQQRPRDSTTFTASIRRDHTHHLLTTASPRNSFQHPSPSNTKKPPATPPPPTLTTACRRPRPHRQHRRQRARATRKATPDVHPPPSAVNPRRTTPQRPSDTITVRPTANPAAAAVLSGRSPWRRSVRTRTRTQLPRPSHPPPPHTPCAPHLEHTSTHIQRAHPAARKKKPQDIWDRERERERERKRR